MLKKAMVIGLIIVFNSCAINKINYSYNFKTIQQGIDFTQSKGSWLLNTIDIPEKKEGRQVNKILKQFNIWTKNNTTLTSKMLDNTGSKFKMLISKNVSKEDCELLYEASNYRYLVNVYLLKNDDSNPKNTITEMMFNVYDLSTKELFLSEKVIGILHYENTTNIGGDIYGFRVGVTPDIISGLIKKGLKRIEKNSKY